MNVLRTAVMGFCLLALAGCNHETRYGQHVPAAATDVGTAAGKDELYIQGSDGQNYVFKPPSKAGTQLPPFNLNVFPEPHQGPIEISADCWQIDSHKSISWGTLVAHIQSALMASSFTSKIYALNQSQPPMGFVIVSSFQPIDDKNQKTDEKKALAFRQFIFVLTPDVVITSREPKPVEKDFRTYASGGLPYLPDPVGDKCFVNTNRDGDHLNLLTYYFSKSDYVADLFAVDNTFNHYEGSGLRRLLRSESGLK